MTLFTMVDNFLLEALENLWEYFEDVLKKSYEYKINVTSDNVKGKSFDVEVIHKGKSEYKKIIVFGVYDPNNELFIWNGATNKMFYDKMIKDNAEQTFGSMKTINKLLEQKVTINKNLYHAIPTLIGFFNPAFNVIKFVNEKTLLEMFALVQLGIPDNINVNNVMAMIGLYKISIMVKLDEPSREKGNNKKSKKNSKKTG